MLRRYFGKTKWTRKRTDLFLNKACDGQTPERELAEEFGQGETRSSRLKSIHRQMELFRYTETASKIHSYRPGKYRELRVGLRFTPWEKLVIEDHHERKVGVQATANILARTPDCIIRYKQEQRMIQRKKPEHAPVVEKPKGLGFA